MGQIKSFANWGYLRFFSLCECGGFKFPTRWLASAVPSWDCNVFWRPFRCGIIVFLHTRYMALCRIRPRVDVEACIDCFFLHKNSDENDSKLPTPILIPLSLLHRVPNVPKDEGKEPQILSSTFRSTVRTKSIQLIKQRLAVFTGDFNDNNLFNHLNRSLINHRGRRHNLKLKRISRHIRTPIHRNNALNGPNQPLTNTTIRNPRSRRNHNINRKTPLLSPGKMGCTAQRWLNGVKGGCLFGFMRQRTPKVRVINISYNSGGLYTINLAPYFCTVEVFLCTKNQGTRQAAAQWNRPIIKPQLQGTVWRRDFIMQLFKEIH